MEKFNAWRRQPTTVAGFAVILGVISGVLSHQMSWAAAIPVLVGGIVSMILPDNSTAKADAVAVANVIVNEEMKRHA
jgi:hypothetical protein